jgi:hypothetical protein
MNIQTATTEYEQWLGTYTPLIKADLAKKHAKMANARSPFSFLRATFYRWMQRFPKVCPGPAEAPEVLAVGDLHVENFGTWRDTEGRLIWGINDFDECFDLPYTIDLVRLATSALLAIRDDHLTADPRLACDAILAGYTDMIERGGHPFVIDEAHRWFVPLIQSKPTNPAQFWQNLRELPASEKPVPRPAINAIRTLMPERDLPCKIAPRQAGAGSLGKPRFVGVATWHGGPVARETKTLCPSAVLWVNGFTKKNPPIHYMKIMENAVRCLDPFFRVEGEWLVRRLAPDCNKIELSASPQADAQMRLLKAMGAETANIHLGTKGAQKEITHDLKKRGKRWLRSAAREMLAATEQDWRDWQEASQTV